MTDSSFMTNEARDDVHVHQAKENHYAMMTKHNHLAYRLLFAAGGLWLVIIVVEAVLQSLPDSPRSLPNVVWLAPSILTGLAASFMYWAHKMQREESSRYLTALDAIQNQQVEQTQHLVDPSNDNVKLLRRKDGSVVGSHGKH